MKKLYSILFIFLLAGCAQHGGGGDYYFEHYDPTTGEITKARVHSVREFESAKVKFKDVEVDIQGVKPGPDNTGKALGIIDTLLKAGAAIP